MVSFHFSPFFQKKNVETILEYTILDIYKCPKSEDPGFCAPIYFLLRVEVFFRQKLRLEPLAYVQLFLADLHLFFGRPRQVTRLNTPAIYNIS
jgi:hypothetical protein